MKLFRFITHLFVSLLAIAALTGCEDDSPLPTIDLTNGTFTSAEFSNPGTGSKVLNFEESEQVFENFAWSPSDYGISIPFQYNLEMDTDPDFSAPIILSTTASNNFSIKVGAMNSNALKKGLAPFEESSVYFRIRTQVSGTQKIDDLYSGTIERTITPYVTEFGSIYMIGEALKGWNIATPVEVYGVAPFQYEVIAEFNNGGAFRFFEAPDWGATSYNWTYFDGGTVDANFVSAADGDTNLRFVGSTGFYRIRVNLSTKVITMEAVDKPTLYMVGAGVPAAGWGWSTPVELTWIKDGHWEVTTDFINDAFRFFTTNNDWGSGRNYPYYQALEYDIDPKLENAQDGDSNFKFNGTPGTYKVILNEIDKTIVMANAGTAGPPKYLVGAATPGGWNWGSAESPDATEAVQVEAGVYKATLYLSNETFRFFDTFNDWGSGTNFPYYVGAGYTIDPNFEDALDGDNNFRFIGKPGTYVLTLNTVTKKITLTGGAGDSMWIVGDGSAAGWNWDNPVDLMQIQTGVFVAKTTLNTAGAFRFFTSKNDWGSGKNYPFYQGEGFTIDAKLTNAQDGDSNFKFTGVNGAFTIIINYNSKTITLE